MSRPMQLGNFARTACVTFHTSRPAQPKHKQAEGGNEMAFAYPVIANGRLYIRDLGTLWVYDIKASG
jgi:hypothetical protein